MLKSGTKSNTSKQMNTITQLNDLAARHGTDGTSPCTKIPFLYVAKFDSIAPPLHHLADPTVSVMIQGTKRIFLDDRVLEYRAGEALINSVGLPITVHMSKASKLRPVLAIGVRLDSTIIRSLMLNSRKMKPTSEAFDVGPASEDLLDSMLRLMKLLDRPDDIPVLAKSLEREIHWRVLQSDLGDVARQLGQVEGHTMKIGKAIAWIRANFGKTIRIERLAKLSAMSSTSFHRHFRNVTSMSPVQYQKKIRLQEARMRLMTTSDDIASVGFAVGYDSPSQFSREYRREFGITPSDESRSHNDRSRLTYRP